MTMLKTCSTTKKENEIKYSKIEQSNEVILK